MHVDPALAAYLIVYKNKISIWNLMTSRRYPNWTLDHSWRFAPKQVNSASRWNSFRMKTMECTVEMSHRTIPFLSFWVYGNWTSPFLNFDLELNVRTLGDDGLQCKKELVRVQISFSSVGRVRDRFTTWVFGLFSSRHPLLQGGIGFSIPMKRFKYRRGLRLKLAHSLMSKLLSYPARNPTWPHHGLYISPLVRTKSSWSFGESSHRLAEPSWHAAGNFSHLNFKMLSIPWCME